MKLYANVYTGNGWAESPQYVEVEITDELLERIDRLAKICVREKLDEVRTSDCTALWEGERSDFTDGAFKLRGQRLEVSAIGAAGDPWFKFCCYEDNTGDIYESIEIGLGQLKTEIAAARSCGSERVLFGLDPEELDDILAHESRVATENAA